MCGILKYTIGTFTGAVLAPADIDGFAGAFGSMASSFGNNFWQTAALVICMIILMFGVGSGIEKANKIMMPVFFVLFIIPVSYTHLLDAMMDNGVTFDYCIGVSAGSANGVSFVAGQRGRNIRFYTEHINEKDVYKRQVKCL